MTTRNILTIRERRVLNYLLATFDWQSKQPDLNMASRDNLTEIVEVLEQVIDSATIPDEQWRSKYLAKDAEV
jgi:hypothetical protein